MRELLNYDPETGHFTWRIHRGGWMVEGRQAGSPARHGYISIRIDRKLFFAHRLAWQHVHGTAPNGELDHINGDPSDNRIANLRPATRSQNIANTKVWRNSKSGVKGVYWNKQNNRWRARLTVNRCCRHVGDFEKLSDAKAAYDHAAREAFGAFAREQR